MAAVCGFVGFTTPVGDEAACLDLAARMLAGVAHRGPDGAAGRHQPGVTMAHCALFDPGGCPQPFVSGGGRTSVVFNGEIYNYHELRRKLLAAGVRLRTGGDTELLIKLYERHGMDFLSQ